MSFCWSLAEQVPKLFFYFLSKDYVGTITIDRMHIFDWNFILYVIRMKLTKFGDIAILTFFVILKILCLIADELTSKSNCYLRKAWVHFFLASILFVIVDIIWSGDTSKFFVHNKAENYVNFLIFSFDMKYLFVS